VAAVAVLARQPHLATGEEVVEAAGVGLVAEAEEHPRRHVALGEAAPQQAQRRDPDAAADQDRAGGAGANAARLGEAVAQRSGRPDPLPGLQFAEPVGARPDRLDQEVEADPARRRSGLGHRDRPRQVRPSPLSRPVAGRRQHVELPGRRLGALAVDQGEEAIAARGPVLGDLAQAAAKRRKTGRARTRERSRIHH
jgi:hypothetical protein